MTGQILFVTFNGKNGKFLFFILRLKMLMVRIFWVSPTSSGNGDYITMTQALAWIELLNEQFPDTDHFIVTDQD